MPHTRDEGPRLVRAKAIRVEALLKAIAGVNDYKRSAVATIQASLMRVGELVDEQDELLDEVKRLEELLPGLDRRKIELQNQLDRALKEDHRDVWNEVEPADVVLREEEIENEVDRLMGGLR
jgi:hypothetical protein